MLDAYSSDWLSPYVPLFVGGAASPGAKTPGAGTPGGGAGGKGALIARVPRSLKLKRLLRGFRVTVNVPTAGPPSPRS